MVNCQSFVQGKAENLNPINGFGKLFPNTADIAICCRDFLQNLLLNVAAVAQTGLILRHSSVGGSLFVVFLKQTDRLSTNRST